MLLCIIFAIIFGFYISLGNLISSIFAPFGLDPIEITRIGLYLLSSGIIGAVLIGAWVDRTSTYKVTTLLILLSTVVFLTITNQTIYHLNESMTLFIVSLILLGFASVAFIPLTLNFAAELTFPLQPALINSIMTLSGQTSATIQSFLYAFFLDVSPTYPDGTEKSDDVFLLD